MTLAGIAVVCISNYQEWNAPAASGALGLIAGVWVMGYKFLKTWTEAKAAGEKGRRTHKTWERHMNVSVDNILQTIAEEWDEEDEDEDEEADDEVEDKKVN